MRSWDLCWRQPAAARCWAEQLPRLWAVFDLPGAGVIELAGITKHHGPVRALGGVDLVVQPGSLYGLLGPNGAGKTTLLRILCTLLAPDAGQVHINGIDALNDPRAARGCLGYVAQEVAIDKILSGRELLTLQGDLHHLPRQRLEAHIGSLTELLGMGDWLDRRCGSYSGGMRRRLDLATALLHHPPLLILDEPTAGLDLDSRAIVWEVLRRLRGEGTTILLSSHYLEEVDALADRLAILDNGEVIAEGSPAALKERLGGDRLTLRLREFSEAHEAERAASLLRDISGVKQVVLNRAQGNSLNLVISDAAVVSAVRERLTDLSLPVFSLTQSRPSLDDVYLQATGRTLTDAELAVASRRDLSAERKAAMR